MLKTLLTNYQQALLSRDYELARAIAKQLKLVSRQKIGKCYACGQWYQYTTDTPLCPACEQNATVI